jgi:hypothetical protein
MMKSNKLVAVLCLNTLLVIGAATLIATPRTAVADDPAPCDNQRCDGIHFCRAGTLMTCLPDWPHSECTTAWCGGGGGDET